MTQSNAANKATGRRFRHATMRDLPQMQKIYARARALMAANGNPTQWGNEFPRESMIEDDIANQRTMLLVDTCNGHERILAQFALCPGKDPTYAKIDGAWLDNDAYVTIHRIAASGLVRHAARDCIRWALKHYGNVRAELELSDASDRALPSRVHAVVMVSDLNKPTMRALQFAKATVPTFLPLDNMVANLSDPGGDRFVQLGITLELADEKTASTVKQYLPSIRNGILMLVSQRTADELLAREGKEKLAADILEEVSAPLGFGANAKKRARDDEDADEDRPRASRKSPVRRVLFSSFIIQ